jgi:hypothetical protein
LVQGAPFFWRPFQDTEKLLLGMIEQSLPF